MPLQLDADQQNADWTKTTWDLPVNSAAELYRFLADRGMSVADFKRLPVYTENVGKLAWLAELDGPAPPGAGLDSWTPAAHPTMFAERAERIWVPPHTREGDPVKGHWRKGRPGEKEATPLPRAQKLKLTPNLIKKIREVGLADPPRHGPVSRKMLTRDGKLYEDTQQMHSRMEEVLGTVDVGGTHSRVVRKQDRVYSKERKKVHATIVKAHLKGKRPVEGKRRAIFMAGGTASGKSTQKKGLPNTDNFVDIDPDVIKAMLPEYKAIRAADERYSTKAVHEESSDIAKLIQAEAMSRKMNVLVDGTGDAEKKKFLKKLQAAHRRNYEVEVITANIPTDEAIDRMIDRGLKIADDGKPNNRFVPVPVVTGIHRGVAARHQEWRSESFVKHWEVWDNTVKPPTLVAEGNKGEITVHDEDLYEKFNRKAEEQIEEAA